MSASSTRLRAVAALSLLYLAIVSCWLIVLAPFEGPDEFHHYDYARYVAVTGHLPDTVPATPMAGGWYTGLWTQEGLYYWAYGRALRAMGVGAAAIEVTPNPRAVFSGGVEAAALIHGVPLAPPLARGLLLGRLANAAFGLITVWCVFFALEAALAAPRDGTAATRRTALAAFGTGCLILVPEFGARHAFVTNDVLATMWASAASALALRWSPRGGVWKSAAIGVCAGCAVATKLTAAVVVLLLPLAVWLWRREPDACVGGQRRLERGGAGARRASAAVGERSELAAVPSAGDDMRDLRPVNADAGGAKSAAPGAGATLTPRLTPHLVAWLVALLAAGAWPFVRNAIVFGDPLATRLKQALVAQFGIPIIFRPFDASSYIDLGRLLFRTFWAAIGWASFGPRSSWIWVIFGIITLLCLVAVLPGIIARRRGVALDLDVDVDDAARAAARAIALSAIVVVLHAIAMLIAVAFVPGHTARYLLPIVTPLLVLAIAGARVMADWLRPHVGDAGLAWATWLVVMSLALAWLGTLRETALAFHFGW